MTTRLYWLLKTRIAPPATVYVLDILGRAAFEVVLLQNLSPSRFMTLLSIIHIKKISQAWYRDIIFCGVHDCCVLFWGICNSGYKGGLMRHKEASHLKAADDHSLLVKSWWLILREQWRGKMPKLSSNETSCHAHQRRWSVHQGDCYIVKLDAMVGEGADALSRRHSLHFHSVIIRSCDHVLSLQRNLRHRLYVFFHQRDVPQLHCLITTFRQG